MEIENYIHKATPIKAWHYDKSMTISELFDIFKSHVEYVEINGKYDGSFAVNEKVYHIGDYVCYDCEDQPYPCKESVFNECFTKVGDKTISFTEEDIKKVKAQLLLMCSDHIINYQCEEMAIPENSRKVYYTLDKQLPVPASLDAIKLVLEIDKKEKKK